MINSVTLSLERYDQLRECEKNIADLTVGYEDSLQNKNDTIFRLDLQIEELQKYIAELKEKYENSIAQTIKTYT